MVDIGQARPRSVYGEMVKRVRARCGRAPSTIYAVLRGEVTSAPIRRAIEQVRAEMQREKGSNLPMSAIQLPTAQVSLADSDHLVIRVFEGTFYHQLRPGVADHLRQKERERSAPARQQPGRDRL